MNNRVVKLGLLLALSCLILVSVVACRSGATNQAKPANVKPTQTANVKPTQTANVKPTQTANVKPGDTVLRVTADGRLAFVDDRSLTFGTIGKVGQVNVSELDRVTKGQVLARLDTTDLEQAVKAGELGVKVAELAAKSAQFDRTQAEYGVKAAEADLKPVQANVKAAGIDLEQATDNFRKITYPYTYSTFIFDVPQAVTFISDAKRQIADADAGLQIGLPADRYYEVSRQLQDALDNLTKGRELLARGQGADVFQSGLLTVKDFWTLRAAQLAMDKAQLAVENAQNVVSKAALAIDSARTALNKAQLGVDKANNDMDVAKNNLTGARNQLDKAVITAPFDGIIARVNVKVGDVLSPVNYTITAIDLIDPSRMECNIRVNELDVPNVKLGQKVTIRVRALPDERFEGVVTSISPLPDVEGSAVSYEVKTVFDVPQKSALKAGMRATVDITCD